MKLNLAAVLILMSICKAEGDPLFEVVKSEFCANVVNHVPVDIYTNPALIKPDDPVCLWIEIRCNSSAFQMLNYFKKFPITHAWGYNGIIIDPIEDGIGISEEEYNNSIGDITSEFKEQGFFTWRTFSRKHYHYSGNWYVSILDANGTPVSKIGSAPLAFRPTTTIEYIK